MFPKIRRAEHEVRERELKRLAICTYLTENLRTAHQLATYLSDIHVWNDQEKSSASATCVLSARAVLPENVLAISGPTDVMLKMSLDNPYCNSLAVERSIYRQVTHNLLNNSHTPHVVGYLAHFLCPWRVLEIPSNSDRRAIAIALKIDADTYDGNVYTLITQRCHGRSLQSWFTDEDAAARRFQSDEKEQLHVIWQIMYTLHVFDQVSLRHNDLHFNNILVEDWSDDDAAHSSRRLFNRGNVVASSNRTQSLQQQPRGTFRFTYNLNQPSADGHTTFEFDSRYCARLFDFNDASIYYPTVPRNSKLDSYGACREFNMCASPHRFYDTFGFLLSIEAMYTNGPIQSEVITNWIDDQLDHDVRQAAMDFAPYLQNSLRGSVEEIVAATGAHLRTPLECLMSLYHHGAGHFRRKRSTYRGSYFLPPSKLEVVWLGKTSLDDENNFLPYRAVLMEELEAFHARALYTCPRLSCVEDSYALFDDIMSQLDELIFYDNRVTNLTSAWTQELQKLEYNWRVAAVHVYEAYAWIMFLDGYVINAPVMLACIILACPMLRAYPPAFQHDMCALFDGTSVIIADVRRTLHGKSPISMPLICGRTMPFL